MSARVGLFLLPPSVIATEHVLSASRLSSSSEKWPGIFFIRAENSNLAEAGNVLPYESVTVSIYNISGSGSRGIK